MKSKLHRLAFWCNVIPCRISQAWLRESSHAIFKMIAFQTRFVILISFIVLRHRFFERTKKRYRRERETWQRV